MAAIDTDSPVHRNSTVCLQLLQRSRACVTRVLLLRYICVFRTFIVVFERSLYLHYIGYSLGILVVRLSCTLLACVSVHELLYSAMVSQ